MALFNTQKLPKTESVKPPTRKYRILLIDDEAFILSTLESLFEFDYEVVTCKSAVEALSLFQEKGFGESIQLMISDQRMLGMTGIELFEEIKPHYPHIVRILLTGYADVNAIVDAVNRGEIYKFVLKPLDSHDLKSTVQRALESWELGFQNRKLLKELQALNNSLESRVQERNKELYDALSMLEKVNIELSTAVEEKERFIGVLAHDLKSPMCGILECTRLLSSSETISPEEAQGLMDALHPGVSNVVDLLDKLLQIATVKQESPENEIASVNLQDVFKRIHALLNPNLLIKELQLSVELDSSLKVKANANQVEMILRNLLSNAIKFTPKGGNIKIFSNLVDGANVQVSIEDDGVGIPENKQAILFKLDKRTTSKGTEGEVGTGLGLILCKDLADFNKGRLDFRSEPGKGSRFNLTLPLLEDE